MERRADVRYSQVTTTKACKCVRTASTAPTAAGILLLTSSRGYMGKCTWLAGAGRVLSVSLHSMASRGGREGHNRRDIPFAQGNGFSAEVARHDSLEKGQ